VWTRSEWNKGSEQAGDRIWVIVSQRTRAKCVVALPLSRHIDKAILPFLVTVPASEITMVDGNPPINRVALTDQIRNLDKGRLRKQAGSVSKRALLSIFSGMDYMLGRQFPHPKSN
jgi:mRNA-degrading endonuclease toxin of MazEF toxin-antitoxin module